MFYFVYDRKSPRHNWQIVVGTENEQHAANCGRIWKERAAQTKGWDKYQQYTAKLAEYPGNYPASLPSNHNWETGLGL